MSFNFKMTILKNVSVYQCAVPAIRIPRVAHILNFQIVDCVIQRLCSDNRPLFIWALKQNARRGKLIPAS